jgi:hypothetical protein
MNFLDLRFLIVGQIQTGEHFFAMLMLPSAWLGIRGSCRLILGSGLRKGAGRKGTGNQQACHGQ